MKIFISITIGLLATLTSCDKRKPDSAGSKSDSEVNQAPISKHEKLAGEVMDAMKELADSVTQVTDIETAKAAATKIDQMSSRFDAIAAQLAPLPTPDEHTRSVISAKMEARGKEMQRVMRDELGKRMETIGPEAAAVIQRALGDFFKKMDKTGNEFERHFKASKQSSGASRRETPSWTSGSKPAGGTP